eukprot:COSAG01_NODE_7387_length_3228_cov_17.737935_3_plen_47_part_00
MCLCRVDHRANRRTLAAEELRLMALVSDEQKQLMVDAQTEVRNRAQ